MVAERNAFAHGVTATEESIVQAELPLHDLLHLQRFKQALEGLTTSRLVVRADMVDVENDGKVRYKLRILQGGNDHFPVREETVQGKLAEEWCYLLRPGGALPLALSPVVA